MFHPIGFHGLIQVVQTKYRLIPRIDSDLNVYITAAQLWLYYVIWGVKMLYPCYSCNMDTRALSEMYAWQIEGAQGVTKRRNGKLGNRKEEMGNGRFVYGEKVRASVNWGESWA